MLNKFSCVLFSVLIVHIYGLSLNAEKDEVRSKRNVMENIQSAVLLGVSEFTGKFQEGVAFKDNSDRELNVFGAKIGGANNFKTGFGHAVEDSSSEENDRRRKRDIEEKEITVDSVEFSDYDVHIEYPEYENYRKRRSIEESDEIEFTTENILDERRKRSATIHKASESDSDSGSDSESDSDSDMSEEFVDVTSEVAVVNRRKRAAKPCFGRKMGNGGGGGGDGDDGEVEELRSSKYRKQRGKRQAPSVVTDVGPNNGFENSFVSNNGPGGQIDANFELFMEKMMESVKKVAQIAKRVQEAFQDPASQ